LHIKYDIEDLPMNRLATGLAICGAAALLTISAPAFAGGCGKMGGHPMKGYGYHHGAPVAYYHPPMRMSKHGGYHHGAHGYKYGAAPGMKGSEAPPALVDIVDTAAAAGSFDTLIKAAKAAGLVDALKGDGPFTVFAPTDEAFAKLPEGTVQALLADEERLAKVLTYHVVPSSLDAQAISSITGMTTVEGSELPVDKLELSVTDIKASNGIIHVIDEVLIPQG
jgi:uncharacterized surface protein with fasciclin (FAS1) repeats